MGNLMLNELVYLRVSPIAFLVVGSFFLASCSSSVSRFEMPAFGLSDKDSSGPTSSYGGAATRLGQGYNDQEAPSGGTGLAEFEQGFEADRSQSYPNSNSRSSYLPPQTAERNTRSARYDIERKPLAPVSGAGDFGRSTTGREPLGSMKPIKEARRSYLPSEPSGYRYNRAPVGNSNTSRQKATQSNNPVELVNGNEITVQAGDTLYAISQRYSVPVVDLMKVNDLSDSNISAGQRLVVPGIKRTTGTTRVAARTTARSAATTSIKRRKPLRATSSGTYTVKNGESFRSIATKLSIDPAALADVNGITDTGYLRPGEVLILPTARKKAVRSPQSDNRKTAARSISKDLKVRAVKTKTISLNKPTSGSIAKKPSRQVSIGKSASKKNKSAKTDGFRWPVRGRIIGKFGDRGNGTHNDGIDLAVPSGTKVKAAESGVVAYAGSELKGYGNLVLIRHENNWVSAYAHNDSLMVKRGDTIKRGQVIARAGKTGSVDQPQVHFELRKGSKPVNPMKHMAGT